MSDPASIPPNTYDIILQPLPTLERNPGAENVPTYLNKDSNRWFIGVLEPWSEFEDEVLNAFMGLQADYGRRTDIVIDTPTPAIADAQRNVRNHVVDPKWLASSFMHHVLVLVELATRILINNESNQARTATSIPPVIQLTDSKALNGPCYIVQTISCSMNGTEHQPPEARLIGHVDSLGGRTNAISMALENPDSTDWGGLKSILGRDLAVSSFYLEAIDVGIGEIAWYMFLGRNKYGFLTCYDETIFLQMEKKSTINGHGVPVSDDASTANGDQNGNGHGPTPQFLRLRYSKVVKHTDTLDETGDTISVRLGMLYMFILIKNHDWSINTDGINPSGYTTTTQWGEDLNPRER